MRLADRIATDKVPDGEVHAYWLYQAGFVFKTSSGARIVVDAYLSDVVRQLYGGRRVVEAPIAPDELQADAFLATHWHEDHLDTGSIEPFAASTDALFVGPHSCALRIEGRGIAPSRVHRLGRGETVRVNGVDITATFARHELAGLVTEDAVGYMLDFGGVRVYHSGDTDYDARLLPLRELGVDVAMICIPGTGASMNVHEAALLAWQLDVTTAIPMHFGLWVPEDYGPGATLDPEAFRRTYTALGGAGTVIIPAIAEPIILHSR